MNATIIQPQLYIAVHRIDVTKPEECARSLDGMRRGRRVAEPGAWLSASDLVEGQAEIERLLASNAIRVPTDDEIASLFEPNAPVEVAPEDEEPFVVEQNPDEVV